MSISLNIHLNQEGFENKGMDCVSLPIAYAASYYTNLNIDENYNPFYLYYAYNTAIQNNWHSDMNVFLEAQNFRLSSMGLEIIEIPTRSQVDFIDSIIRFLNIYCPVFMFLNYYNLWYCENTYMKSKLGHGILVSGYDRKKQIFEIRENVHIDMAAPLYSFQLKEEQLYDLWQKSNDTFGWNNQNIYYIRKNNDIKTVDLMCVFDDFISNRKRLQNNTLVQHIIKYSENIKFWSETDFQKKMIMTYIEGIEMLFHIMFRIVGSSCPTEDKNELIKLKNDIKMTREGIINLLITKSYRLKELSEDQKEKMIFDLNTSDDNMYAGISEWSNKLRQ